MKLLLKRVFQPAYLNLTGASRPRFQCPNCGYSGVFKDKLISPSPHLVRKFSKCPGCGAAERHRMLKLVTEELFGDGQARSRSVLHMAPEACMMPWIKSLFGNYHTSDFMMKGVDFREDVQNMSFPDGSYDCVIISRVLTIPPDLDASIRELHRILKPGGVALIAEIHSRNTTLEYGEMRNSRSRLVGMDILDHYAKYFSRVERFDASRYPQEYQLINRMNLEGKPNDDYPEEIRELGLGFRELVAVCHA